MTVQWLWLECPLDAPAKIVGVNLRRQSLQFVWHLRQAGRSGPRRYRRSQLLGLSRPACSAWGNSAASPAENGLRLPSRGPSRRLRKSGTSCTCEGCTSIVFPDAQQPKPASTQLSCSIPVIHAVAGDCGLGPSRVPEAGARSFTSREAPQSVRLREARPVSEHTDTCSGLRLLSVGLGSSSCHPPTASANPLHRPAGLRVALLEQPWSKP